MVDASDLLRQAQLANSAVNRSPANIIRNTPNPSGVQLSDFDFSTQTPELDGGGGFFDALKGAVGTTLDVIDTPRAAIVSTVKEGVDAFQGEGFSFSDWFDQTRDNYGFGELIEEETDIDNIWVKRGLGLVGDVVFDPLSFVGGASKITQLGRKGLAGRAFDLGDAALGQKILRGGTSSASAKDLQFLSGSNGTVKAVEGLEKGIFLGVGSRQVKISGYGSGTLLYDKLAGAARTSRVAPRVGSLLGGRNAAAKAVLMNGTPDEASQAFRTIRAVALESGRVQPFMQDAERSAAGLIDQIKDPETDKLVQQALGGNESAIASLAESNGPDFFPQFREFTDGLVTKGNAHVDAEVFVGRDNWQPTALSDEFADWLDRSNRAGGKSKLKEGFERKAGLVPGEKFLGTELVAPNAHPDGLDVRSQVRGIIAEQQQEFGGEHLNQLFAEGFSQSIVAHMKSYGNAVRKRSIEQHLVREGIAEPLFESVGDALPFEDALSLAKADNMLDDWSLQARRQALDSEAAAEAGLRDVIGQPQSTPQDYSDVAEELAALRGRRFRLNRDQLDVKSRRHIAGVQRKIDGANVKLARIEASLVAEGLDIPDFVPGGGVAAEPVGGLFRRTGIGYELDEAGAYSARFENVVAIGDVDSIDQTMRDQLAGAGYDAVYTDNGYVPLSSEQIIFANGDVAPGFQQPVDDHIRKIRDRKAKSSDALWGEVEKIGFDPGMHTAKPDAARVARQVNADKLADDTVTDAADRALRNRAERVFARVDELGEGAEADTARLSAQADVAAAEFGESTLDGDTMLKALRRRDFQESLSFNMKDGFSKLSDTSQAPDIVVETVQGGAKLFEDDGSKLLDYWDTANRSFKTYAILTPGFHSRNFMGGVFNNFLAGVSPGTTQKAIRLDRAYKKALKGSDSVEARRHLIENFGEDGAAYAQAIEFGAIGGGQTSEVAEAFSDLGQAGSRRFQTKTKLPQGPINNAVTRKSFEVGSKVEDVLRSSLFIDRVRKGAAPSEALGDVHKFHFDYDDLSAFESQVARRVVPFYTWSRKNLPLQIEGLLTNPKAYNRYQHVKRNIELGTEEEETVPGYVEEGLHIRLPFELPGGRTYIIPELPFKELTRTVDPGEIFGSTSPLVKTPLERKFGKKSFQNVPFRIDPQEVPASWPGIGRALELIGKAEEIDGKYYAKDVDLHTVEQAMPVLARLRRSLPSDSDDAFKDRQTTTLVNLFLGLGLFTNTERAQNNELYRREVESQDARRYESALAQLASQ